MASSKSKSVQIRCPHENARAAFYIFSTLRPDFKKVCLQALHLQDPCGQSAKMMQNVHFYKKAFPCGWPIKAGTNQPNRWMSETFGETLVRSGTNMFGMFSCVGAFGAARASSATIQHAKSEEVGCQPSEPLESLTGGVLAACGRGRILCVLCFCMHSVPSFLVFMFWSTGTRLPVMSIQGKLICVRLVMPCCMFSMQMFLSEIVTFHFDQK